MRIRERRSHLNAAVNEDNSNDSVSDAVDLEEANAVAQRIGGPPTINGKATTSAAKSRFVRIPYEKTLQGR